MDFEKAAAMGVGADESFRSLASFGEYRKQLAESIPLAPVRARYPKTGEFPQITVRGPAGSPWSKSVGAAAEKTVALKKSMFLVPPAAMVFYTMTEAQMDELSKKRRLSFPDSLLK